jgi:hypothetical protein
VYQDLMNRVRNAGVPVAALAVFRELHKPGPDSVAHAHFHVALRAADKFRFMPVKRSLMAHHGLASHWSTHDGYWSALRYCYMPSPSKPMPTLDRRPLLWAAGGEHPPIETAINEAMTAGAIAARRAAMEMAAAEQGTTAPKVTEVDIYPLVIQQGFRNGPDYRHADKDLPGSGPPASQVHRQALSKWSASGTETRAGSARPTGHKGNVIYLDMDFLFWPVTEAGVPGTVVLDARVASK